MRKIVRHRIKSRISQSKRSLYIFDVFRSVCVSPVTHHQLSIFHLVFVVILIQLRRIVRLHVCVTVCRITN